MNSEELERSLRTEFENYLTNLVADMRKEAAELEARMNEGFERHRAQLDEAVKAFGEAADSRKELEAGFLASLSEHLRLARDEGAKVAATAMAEAEKFEREQLPEPVPPAYDKLRDAINDISSKDSQSSILKALVHHAGDFAAAGAFFIIKNDHFLGWKALGTEDESAEATVRDVHFPTSADSILGAAVRSLATVSARPGDHSDDAQLLQPVAGENIENVYAVPLIARGRGVAVLYVRQSEGEAPPNVDALEALVRVSALTVELLAASVSPRDAAPAAVPVEAVPFEPAHEVAEPVFEEAEPAVAVEADAHSDFSTFEQEPEPTTDHSFSFTESTPFEPAEATDLSEAEPVQVFEETTEFATSFEVPDEPSSPFVQTVEEFAAPVETFRDEVVEASPAASFTDAMPSNAFEPAVEAPVFEPSMPRSRFSDRAVDLPIEVPEDERRSHNDARRFARLLVSEIKLYNEKKVEEGRESNDLYDRLREAIDRSREMYDKRVQPPVAAKFDYFHYELVNSLAEGNAQRLGTSYPGLGS